MISRAKMPRQLRNKGGITSVVPREKYGIGSTFQKFKDKALDRTRKLIPNELASVAVKAAPFVAPFSPKTAALMRGIGRFDQRGSLSDALKQGLATFAFGAGARKLGGAPDVFGNFSLSSPLSPERTQAFTSLFDKQQATQLSDVEKAEQGLNIDKGGILSTTKNLAKASIKKLPEGVVAQLVAGGLTAGASLLASYFQGEFEEPEPGESMEEYLERRREYVGTQMRTYMDNYFANDPEYSALDDAGRDAFVARYNIRDGGRIGYQTGGITMANTLAENIRRNRAAQAAFQQSIAPAQERARQKAFNVFMTPKGTVAKDQGIAQLARDTGKAPSITNLPITSGTDISRMIGPGTGIGEGKTSYGGAQQFSNLGFAALPSSGQKTTTTPTTTVSQTNTAPDLTKQSEAYGKMMMQKFQEAYGKPEDYKAEAATLGMPVEAYYDYITTQDPKGIAYKFRKQDPYYAPEFDIAPDPKEQEELDPLRIYFNRELQRQIDAGIPESERIKFGQVLAPVTTLPSSGIMPSMYESYADALARTRKQMGLAKGGMPVGIMRTNKAGVMERDYRDKGGFVPVGIKEKADDVPAMLSKNEFVFTADAVRGAGNGSIERGAQKMYDTMKRLEKRVV